MEVEEEEVGEEVASVEVVVAMVVAAEDSEEAEVEVDSEVEDDEGLSVWDVSFHLLGRLPVRIQKQHLGPSL